MLIIIISVFFSRCCLTIIVKNKPETCFSGSILTTNAILLPRHFKMTRRKKEKMQESREDVDATNQRQLECPCDGYFWVEAQNFWLVVVNQRNFKMWWWDGLI